MKQKNNKTIISNKIIMFSVCLLLLTILTACGEKKMTNKIAIMDTNMGIIKIELFEDKMPITTKNFITLIENKFYDGTKFHRVIENFMIQGGDPLTKNNNKKQLWGTGGPGYEIKDEFHDSLSNVPGTISMANHGPNSGGSQFFINTKDNSFLDHNKPPMSSKHPVFGKVIEGLDVVNKINSVDTSRDDVPANDVIINKITLE